jgi:hypothetical protein
MREQLILNVVSLAIIAVSLGIAVWAVISGQAMSEGLDGLFLVLFCLMCAAVFAIVPLKTIRQGSIRALLNFDQGKKDQQDT